jgi:hypothetical protein
MPDLPHRPRLGRLLDRLGQLTLPLGIGALGGYLAADQDVRLVPDMLGVLLAWSFIGLVLIVSGRLLAGKAVTETDTGRRVRRRVILAMALALLALSARLGLWWTEQPTDLTRLTPAEFEGAFAVDTARYQAHAAALDTLAAQLDAADVPPAGHEQVLTPDEEALLRETWSAVHDISVDLDQVRLFWEDWYRYDPSRVERSEHLRSFLLTYAAELALYRAGTRISRRVLENRNAVKFLDAPHPEAGLPAGTFSRFREQVLGVRDQARVLAGDQYLATVGRGLHARREAQRLGVGWLLADVRDHIDTIERVAPIDRAVLTVRADTQLLKRGVRRTWYPIQKNTAEWMGDRRTRRIGWYLIDAAAVAQVEADLQPGDILLSRKNWYLSNVGLPGFWPHGLLYTGPPSTFDAYFDDPMVRAWLAAQPDAPRTLAEHLAHVAPQAWAAYQLGHDGHPNQVIEAVSEGVLFNTWAHAAGDYLAALRPTDMGKVERARALSRAFEMYARPYDFDFDFATDHAVVCTELVWRAWRSDGDEPGLDLPLSRVAGRMTLPANDLVRFYDAHADDPVPPLEFVFFIDARERTHSVVFADEAALRGSWQRAKWDIVQE